MDKVTIEKAASIKDVISITSFSRSTIYRRIAKAGFPKPIKISRRRVIWDEVKVKEWLDNEATKYAQ